MTKKILLSIAAFLTVLAGGYGLNELGGGVGLERVSYDVIGTASTPTSTNPNWAGNRKVILSEGMENLHLDMEFTPWVTSGTLFIMVEGSNDSGTTYFPISSYVAQSDGIVDQLNVDPIGVTTTDSGIPIAFPNVVSDSMSDSVASTTYKGMIDLKVVADHIRISAIESTTEKYGFAYVRATLTNNQ